MNFKTTRHLLLSLACTASLGIASAAPVPIDLIINGSVTLDTTNSADALGGSAQNGTLRHVSGGMSTTSSFSGDPAGLAPSMLSGGLSDTGDGIGVRFDMSGMAAGAENSVGLFADYALALANNSLTETFTIVFRAFIANAVSASGADAFAYSDISVKDGANNEILFSDYKADTLDPGQNFTLDSANDFFTVVLAPGASANFSALQKQRGGVYQPGAFSASLDAFLTIESVRGSGGGNPIPLPGSLPLVGLGLALLALARRRAHAV